MFSQRFFVCIRLGAYLCTSVFLITYIRINFYGGLWVNAIRSDVGKAALQTFFRKILPKFAKSAPFKGDIERKEKYTASVGMEGGELS